MSANETSLASVQRDFARVIRALAGAGADGGEWAQASLRADRGIPASERIRVYADAYLSRIHEVLREDYGALHAALGEEGFRDLARLYLMAHPPHAFSLRHVGAELPRFLAGPVAEAFRKRVPHAAELAALDWAIADVFDAADVPVLSREALAGIPADDWGGLRFALVPAHRLLQLDWPVQRVRSAWDADAPLPGIERSATTLLVHRRAEQTYYRAVPDVEAQALAALGAGEEFAAVCAGIAAASDEREAPARIGGLLERWLADGILSLPQA